MRKIKIKRKSTLSKGKPTRDTFVGLSDRQKKTLKLTDIYCPKYKRFKQPGRDVAEGSNGSPGISLNAALYYIASCKSVETNDVMLKFIEYVTKFSNSIPKGMSLATWFDITPRQEVLTHFKHLDI